MSLRIISGRSGAGKSAFVRAEMAAAAKDGKNAVLIVPDQYTFDAELALMDEMGGGMLGAQVLGFTRLAERVLAEAGGHTRLFLNADGKRMALRKVIEERKGELIVYRSVSARMGFTEPFCDLISNFKYSAVSPVDVAEAAEKIDDELLRAKIKDIAALYDGLEAFMAGKYIDDEDMQALLAEKIPQAGFLQGAQIFVDSLPFFLYKTQTYRIIEQLLTTAEQVSVTIRCGEYDDEDAAIFLEEAHVGSRLSEIAQGREIPVERVHLGRDVGEKRNAPPAVLALERQLFVPTLPQQLPDDAGILLREASDRKTEVEAAVNRINELLRSGVRYRDIAVVLGDPEAYKPLLRRALTAHEFAFFMDEKRPLMSHPVVELILSSLYAALRGLRRDEVLRAVKTGFFGVDAACAEAFEVYCLRFNVSFGGFDMPFAKTAKDCTCYAEAEVARLAAVPPLRAFADALGGAKSARTHAELTYRYLTELGVREALVALCEKLEGEGRYDDAAENAQVWNAVMVLLDQIAELLDGEMTGARFAAVVEEGCAAHEIGVIPASTDQILVGDVERTSNRKISHMLVLGCNDGAIPREMSQDEIINAADRAKLREAGCALDAHDSDLHERQIVYACLSRAEQSLWVSWAKTDSAGKTLQPSFVAERLSALFPNTAEIAKEGGVRDAWCARRGFSRLMRGLRAVCDGEIAEDGLDGALAYFSGNEPEKLGNILSRLSFAGLPVDAKKLYGPWTRSSVTRIETFNSCPYKHMVQYGLRPTIRREYKEQASDEGDFFHMAFDQFVRLVREKELDWEELGEKQVKELLEPILDQLIEEHNDGVLKSSARNAYAARRMKRTAQRTMWAAVKQIQSGDYRPAYSELRFGEEGTFAVELPNGERAELRGVIDRVDKNGACIRVVDYKSGKQSFSFDELAAGVKLQLPLYMLAALEELKHEAGDSGESPTPGGMFYLRVDDPVVSADEPDPERARMKGYRLDGVLVQGEAVAMDEAMDGHSDVLGRVRRTKEGWKGEGLLSGEQMAQTLEFARECTADSVARILAGEAQIAPVRTHGFASCDRCSYRSICRFEPDSGQFVVVEPLSATKFFESLANRGEDGGEVQP